MTKFGMSALANLSKRWTRRLPGTKPSEAASLQRQAPGRTAEVRFVLNHSLPVKRPIRLKPDNNISQSGYKEGMQPNPQQLHHSDVV